MSSTSDMSDEFLAARFKREHSKQFETLVQMHLSFLLDLNTDNNDCLMEQDKTKKWNRIHFSKKSKPRSIIEGAPLTHEGICRIYQLIEFLKKEQNIKAEGIFRRTGSIERQQELKNLLSQGITLQLEGGAYSVHDCASVLKSFLADLPDPLLTEAHFPAYCQIAKSCIVDCQSTQENKLLEAIQLLLLLLPTENKVLLQDLLELLHLTTSYEEHNRMSPENLAKLFAPHLLCPRKLSPENLLKVSKILFGIVTFMIKKAPELFKIPTKLVVEFRSMKYDQNGIRSPTKRLDESMADAANTVFTFVDHERTAKENESNPTETALANLYAYIQSLPESSRKRRLVKHFNKENGCGTPLQVIRSGISKNKSFGDSIKRHIFHRRLAQRKGLSLLRSSSNEILDSPRNHSPSIVARARLFCYKNESSSDVSIEEVTHKKTELTKENVTMESKKIMRDTKTNPSKINIILDDDSPSCKMYLTSTPACLPLRACSDMVFTPEGQDRKSMSPITRSTQRMTRAMQETMMTPRSRKPVLVLSGTNINALHKDGQSTCVMNKMEELTENSIEEGSSEQPSNFKKSQSEGNIYEPKSMKIPKKNKSDTEHFSCITHTFREYLCGRDIETLSSPMDSSFSSRTDDFNSSDLNDFNDSKLSDSLLYCLNGNNPDDIGTMEKNSEQEKELVLKPKQFDKNGKPIMFETSF